MRSDRTLFYPLELRGAGTGAVESLRSYVERLALAHRLNPTTLMGELLLRYPLQGRVTSARNVTDSWWVLGTGEVARALTENLGAATSVSLQGATLSHFQHVIPSIGLTRREPFHCPYCVNERLEDELPYGRLLWQVAAVEACPIHRVKLRTSRQCGLAPEQHLAIPMRPIHPGVCNSCGSIGFRCLAEHPVEVATPTQIWVAEQVSKLLEMTAAEAQQLSFERLRVGIQEAVDQRFDGQAVKASVEAGLARATVGSWLSGSSVPTLASLLRFCMHAGCDLVTLMGGHWRINDVALGAAMSLKRRSYRRSPLTDDEFRALILAASRATPPESGAQLARRLNVDPKTFRDRFPNEYTLLQVARKGQQRLEKEARYQQFADRFESAARLLKDRGVPVTRRSLQAEAAITVFKGSGSRTQALETVLQRRGCFASEVGARDG
jgi:hypothetical protein